MSYGLALGSEFITHKDTTYLFYKKIQIRTVYPPGVTGQPSQYIIDLNIPVGACLVFISQDFLVNGNDFGYLQVHLTQYRASNPGNLFQPGQKGSSALICFGPSDYFGGTVTETATAYVFVRADKMPMPSYGVAIYNGEGKVGYHSGGTLLDPYAFYRQTNYSGSSAGVPITFPRSDATYAYSYTAESLYYRNGSTIWTKTPIGPTIPAIRRSDYD